MIESESTDPAVIRLDARFVARAGRFAAGFAAQRSRVGDLAGRARRVGGGDELVGHRPLRAGEDARDLDWEVYARLDRPFVRERRQEAGERWAVALDTSSSMGLGEPSKLRRAAETACALVACGLQLGARVELVTFARDGGAGAEVEVCSRDTDWLRCVHRLDGRRAEGARSIAELCAHRRVLAARRVFLVSDSFDCAPQRVLALARRGRSSTVVAILAPSELDARSGEGVVWFDPERGERVAVELDGSTVDRYRAALRAHIEHWSAALARRGQTWRLASSADEFEDIARSAL